MSGRMQDVHLVEDDDWSAAGSPPRSRTRPGDGRPGDDGPRDDARTDAAPPAPTSGWVRAHVRVLVPAALAIALALGGTQVVLDGRERARLAALAEVGGVLRPVESDLRVRWEAGADDARVVESGVAVDGAVIGAAPLAGDRVEVRALDEATGALRWSHDLALPTPVMTQGGAPVTWTACTSVSPGPPPVVACLAQQPGGDGGPTPQVAVWFLDASDGTLRSERTLPGDAAFTVLDGLFVAALRVEEREDSLRWVVRASDPATGRVVWSFTTPRLSAPGVTDPSRGTWSPSYVSLDAREGRVLLAVGRSSWLLDATGTLVRRDRLDPAWWPELTRGGAVVHSTWSGDGEPRARMLLAHGGRVTVDAAPLWLSVDDGTAPGAVFFAQQAGGRDGAAGSVSARDAGTGDLRWRVTGVEATSALLLDDRLYVAGEEGVFAIDATTGRVVWTSDPHHPVDELATDGRRLLLRGPGPVVEALAASDGARLWRADLADAGLERGTELRVGWQLPRLYALRADGSVAVLG